MHEQFAEHSKFVKMFWQKFDSYSQTFRPTKLKCCTDTLFIYVCEWLYTLKWDGQNCAHPWSPSARCGPLQMLQCNLASTDAAAALLLHLPATNSCQSMGIPCGSQHRILCLVICCFPVNLNCHSESTVSSLHLHMWTCDCLSPSSSLACSHSWSCLLHCPLPVRESLSTQTHTSPSKLRGCWSILGRNVRSSCHIKAPSHCLNQSVPV